MKYKLGKLPPKIDSRTLKLAKYIDRSKLPALLPAVNWSDAVSAEWGMMGNDSLGDCTCAAMGHIVMAITANAGVMKTPSDAEVLAMYENIGGYKPGDESTDNGATELDALNYMRASGLAGVKLDAFADIGQTDLGIVKMAIQLFGPIYIGVAIKKSDMARFQAGLPWAIEPAEEDDPSNTVLGGHAIPVLDFDAASGTCVTWGKLQLFTWAWFLARCDEVHAALFFDWISDLGTAPSGLDLKALEADLRAICQ